MPQAKSTTSRPLWSDPFASEKTLPCSFEIIVAISSKFFSIRFLNLKRMEERFVNAVSAHSN